MVERSRYESRSLSSALLTYLQGLGWNVTSVEEAFITEVPLTLPAVSVHFIVSREQERQMGRLSKSFKRPVQIDVYMETRQRSVSIIDSIGDFMDEIPIVVKDQNNATIANMICFDTESITLDTLSPNETAPEVLRWRGVAKCIYEVDYIN